MMLLLSRTGLRQLESAIAIGAQTERRGKAWAGEGPAWRRDLTGRANDTCHCTSRLPEDNSANSQAPSSFVAG
jgi:hypothetical protein